MNAIIKKSLLIIDDHPVYRDALGEKLTLEFIDDGVEVAVASSANEGLELIENTDKHWIVLLDILMPGLSGLAGIKVFKDLHNVQQVVAISGLDEHAWEPKTASAGASMFLSKNNTAEFIIRKLKPLLALQTNYVAKTENVEPKEFRLTQRQREVLDLISQGHPNKLIADFLDISEQTVKIHINQIFKELRVFNRTQAVLKAQKHQLLS
ncbi:response regulator transcription factor [Limnohabitans sp.]|jgi:DNA-binding NarL/FixJ family response regulator|uniref:response regulator transcription factor n=1 Tax=Limnohabitans sp. TaxID=1907725 RepID=UPI00286F4132|nr:response regulator transcription factor [Limnohabitans sp.]